MLLLSPLFQPRYSGLGARAGLAPLHFVAVLQTAPQFRLLENCSAPDAWPLGAQVGLASFILFGVTRTTISSS